MAIGLTWSNIFVMVGLVATLLTGLVAGVGAMVEWRLEAINRQLVDRMTLYSAQIEQFDRRLEILENASH